MNDTIYSVELKLVKAIIALLHAQQEQDSYLSERTREELSASLCELESTVQNT